ncbi:unnamed protein product (macronuclear) [Paramecium tetraurelia]|uniref:Uncharacterized protein n=1 Tax=Paramecium tetraurelia TaxID=5888 RepID=A0CQA3_PARTE|nr:uncharacterized protein GSPATT00009318001 [Paramecium tetraurelia]CAK72970.1 unnamed protein product [Paramecium tetraurelia]|eukprot:XP_001440367.1 hypothetical protein (macronuclear) [Paramecium tetraurelia strain d4-2]
MHKFVTPETFVHKVENDYFIKKKHSPDLKTQEKKQNELNFELYQNLKDLRNNNQLIQNKQGSLKIINPLNKQINMMETKKQQQEKKMRDTQFELKKKSMLNENQQNLQSDLKNLDKISVSAFKDFKEQVNLYNKYYSNSIGQEPEISDIQYEDLNIPYQFVDNGSRYAYREKLNHEIPEINYQNNQAQTIIETIPQLKFSDEQLENKLLNRLKQHIVVRQLDQMENDYLIAIRNNDLSGLKLMLISDETFIQTKDFIGQTGLHLAVKRNYYDICQELINHQVDVFAIDYGNRTGRQMAEKYNYFKVAKLIQMEEDQIRRNLQS